ncbi:MAG TPA: hypothetical protein VJU82_18600, partial [Acidobacteriaceae bacterium]|nr:hypothetical protein [Acidobacteriaceae bacterium]
MVLALLATMKGSWRNGLAVLVGILFSDAWYRGDHNQHPLLDWPTVLRTVGGVLLAFLGFSLWISYRR